MGDAENALPASKKRAAGREISRDNPGLDDDDDTSEQEVGTFKKASEEVLAARRIVKVKRNPTPASASSNPFANISLMPPSTQPSAKEPEVTNNTEKAPATTETNEKDTPNEENQEAESVNKEETGSTEKPTRAEEKEGQESKKDNGNGDASTTPLNSFQQLSSNQNAFTGIAGTGFSTSTFSFGSLSKDGPGPGSGSLFGMKTDKTSSFPSFNFGSSNNGGGSSSSSLFGTPDVGKSEGSGSHLQEKHVETGEENEKAVFTADAVLFEYLDGGWKERGKGELKLNVPTAGVERARLVMRARGNYRLILNASLFPDMKLANMEKRGVSFACINSSTGEEKNGLTTFALKFRDGTVVEEFRAAVMEHKGKKAAAADLKTPENSPKASDD